jgi:hypothetical protein
MSFDEIFEAWYWEASDWTPPGEGAIGICRQCCWSPVTDFGLFAEMPHDVVHGLLVRLEGYVAGVLASTLSDAPGDEVINLAIARRLPRITDIAAIVEEKVQAFVDAEMEGVDSERLH